MGLLRLLKNAIDTQLGLHVNDERKRLYLFRLLDEQGRLATSFRTSTDKIDKARSHIEFNQRCKVQSIETVTDQLVYNVHAQDCNGKARTFKMERLS